MRLLNRLRNLWRRPALERDFDEELRFHFDMRVERNLRGGMTREAAETEARRHMGSTLRAREGMHDARVVPWVESIGRDVTYAFRSLVRQRAFTAVAVLTIALGIGANTAIYSVLQAVWIDAVPFPDPSRLVLVQGYQRGWNAFAELRDASRSFTHLVPLQRRADSVRIGDTWQMVTSTGVTDALFSATGVTPLLGRPFLPADLEAGAPPVVLLTYGFWQDNFGGNPDVVGRTLRMRALLGRERSEHLATIVGVLPADARVMTWGQSVWVPIPLADRGPDGRPFNEILGRLHPDASLASALEEVQTLVKRFDAKHGLASEAEPFRLITLRDAVVGVGIGQSLFLLLGATGIVLVIACANVANLLLARGLDVRKEMAVRSAIGAGRGRLIRQAFLEYSLLAAAGCALGIAIATTARDALVGVMPYNLPRADAIAIDWRVMLFGAALAAATAIATGLLPALRSSAVRPVAVLTSAGSQSTTAPRRRIAHALVAAEVALSVVVLAAAGLLVGSFLRLTAIDPGFESGNVATFSADPSVNTLRLSTDSALRVLDELARAPGVSAAAVSETVPFAGMNLGREVRAPGGTVGLMTRSHIVSPGYFAAMGIEIRAGRDFQRTDTPDGQPVVIVSERVARALWPGRAAVGERLNVLLKSGVPAVVVGVVNDVRTALDRDPVPGVYLLLTQAVADGYRPYHVFVVKTNGAPVPIVQRLESRITEITGNAVTNLTALDTSVSRSVHVPRFRALLFGLMGLLVVVLTAVGVFSVTAHVVAQRRREMGIRMAIGAQGRQVLRLTLRQSALPVLLGAAVGIAGALATTTLVGQFLYATSPTDPFTFAVVVCAVVTIAMVAATVPARRTLRINPLDVLRLD